MSSGNGLLRLIASLQTSKIKQFAVNSDGMEDWEDDREDALIEEGANAVTSKRTDRRAIFFDTFLSDSTPLHAVLLDLDVPAYLIPSSTPGHSHLYIDVVATEENYFALLDALANCNVIERGYANASKKKGATYLRLPWVKK